MLDSSQAPFGSTEAFAKTRRWGIPLCDNDHWVFVWLDWDTHTIGLFDSERKPTSESWAKPVSATHPSSDSHVSPL